jgi:hypothetical protein
MDGAVVTIPGFQEITRIVRILSPPLVWFVASPAHSKPQCFDDSRDSKNDAIWGARREMQRRRRHAPSCMGATDGQRNWPKTRKTLGKPGFFSGEDRNRTTYKSPGKIGVSKRGGAKSDARRKYRQRTSDGSRIEGTRVCTRTTKAWPVWNSIPSTFHFLNSTH